MDYSNENVTKVLQNLEKFHKELEEGVLLFQMIVAVQSNNSPKDAETAHKICEMLTSQKNIVKEQIDLLNAI